MTHSKTLTGHLAALICILVWGTTFVSTKVLLRAFLPVEILLFRFLLGYAALWLACPRFLRIADRRQEVLFACAGLCGVTLYFLLENVALTYTFASNVGVIVAVSPFFAGLLAFWLLRAERPGLNFFLGFAAAMLGIGLISFSGSTQLRLNPAGDVLAVLAGLSWAGYSIITRKLMSFGYNSLLVTRRCFFYGLLFMLPALPFMGFQWRLERLADVTNSANLLFLGLGASALCFVTWTFAIKRLGAVKSCAYIYLVPVVTVVTAVLVLHERITLMAAAGIALTMLGLGISEMRGFSALKKANTLRG
ncbi:DMT family transporter [Desulfovibrio desulfuricans]|uniref:DMT family transporter n=1 Tax=Desulfovibrio desulfuricans TaxID=876 RepID=A0A4P7UG23_DESDE|nr:DMT family transporter [Desulfovibrio desulfuricans]QCC84975.1 DMT family transporter [Desulfovibrio desulfuricans]